MEHPMYSDRPYGHGHSGMKMFLPLLLVPVAFGLMRGMARHKHAHMHMMQDENFVPPFFAELHRRAHAAEAKQAAQPAQTPPPVAEA